MSHEPTESTDTDPFGSTTGAPTYVARPACARALDELLAAVRSDATCIALVGPNGIGKTQLVRVLAERLEEEAELLLLPYAAVEFPDLCHWALGLLGEAQGPFSDPGGALLEAAARRTASGRRLILAIDDASGLPHDTARELSALVRQAGGELQLLVIPVDDPRAGRVLAALGPELAVVRFTEPMSADETAHYVRERLRASGASVAIQERFTEPALAWLHRETGGLPRELHILAVQYLRGRPEADRDRFSRDEQWLEIDASDSEFDTESEPATEEDQTEAPPPRKSIPPPTGTPPRTTDDDSNWLRNRLPLMAGLGLVALGIVFALRPEAPQPVVTIELPALEEAELEQAEPPPPQPLEPTPPSDPIVREAEPTEPQPVRSDPLEPEAPAVVEEPPSSPSAPHEAPVEPPPEPAPEVEEAAPPEPEPVIEEPVAPEPTPVVEEPVAPEPEPVIEEPVAP
ncbi:MAG: AAA family ATPase, partial [bacterium]|nr:AAA family ATPase [bacterium]